MSLREDISTLKALVSLATNYPPDDYPPGLGTFEDHMADLTETWAKVKVKSTNIEAIQYYEGEMVKMIERYRQGDKRGGQASAHALYNFDLSTLK